MDELRGTACWLLKNRRLLLVDNIFLGLICGLNSLHIIFPLSSSLTQFCKNNNGVFPHGSKTSPITPLPTNVDLLRLTDGIY